MSALLVRLMNTIRPLEVVDAAASSVVPNVTRCGLRRRARSVWRQGNLPAVPGITRRARERRRGFRVQPTHPAVGNP